MHPKIPDSNTIGSRDFLRLTLNMKASKSPEAREYFHIIEGRGGGLVPKFASEIRAPNFASKDIGDK